MGKRPLSPAQRRWLLDEVDGWRIGGVVSAEQADAILDLYESPRQNSARQQTVAVYVLVGIAASFVGLAAFLLIGYNWELLPDALKLVVTLAALAGAQALGFWLRYSVRTKVFSEFAFLLGCLCYGAAIALIATIFQLGDHPPDGLWWWALGVVPLALALDTLVLHLLAATLLAVWVGMELLGGWHDAPGPLALLTHSCLTLPLFAGLGLVWAYRKQSPTTVGLYVPLVAWWLALLPLPFTGHLEANPLLYLGGVGALLLIVAELHAPGSRLAVPYRLYGALLCLGVLSVASFIDMQIDLARVGDRTVFIVPSVLVAVASAVVFAVALAVRWRREHMSYERPLLGLAVQQWLPLSMAALMLLMTLWHAAIGTLAGPFAARHDGLVAVVPTVAANVGMVVLAFGLMQHGLREERGMPAAGGVVFLLLWSVLRYAEWFGGRGGMLGASCMFFLCGAAIFAFAMFWHQRKKRAGVAHVTELE